MCLRGARGSRWTRIWACSRARVNLKVVDSGDEHTVDIDVTCISTSHTNDNDPVKFVAVYIKSVAHGVLQLCVAAAALSQ
jgi:hypothetical protein